MEKMDIGVLEALGEVNRDLEDKIDNLWSELDLRDLDQRDLVYTTSSTYNGILRSENKAMKIRQQALLSEVRRFHREKEEFHRHKIKEQAILARTVTSLRNSIIFENSFLDDMSMDAGAV
jgi:hypothetical protein